MKENLRDYIHKQRPHLADSSINTYVSIITNLFKKMNGTGDIIDFFKKNVKEVLEYLKDKDGKLRKTQLASLVTLTGDPKYRELMIEDAVKYNDGLKDQKMTDKQRDNWMSFADVKKTYDHLFKSQNHLFTKEHLTKNEMMKLMDLVLLSLYVLIPPRRNQDYTLMKIKNYNPETDNYWFKNKFYFNQYKTKKEYHEQVITIPPKLRTILNKWTKINPTDYLLFDRSMKRLSSPQLTRRLNLIFGKNISTSMLRHIFISDKVLKATPALRKLEEVAREMGHNTGTQALYRKIK